MACKRNETKLQNDSQQHNKLAFSYAHTHTPVHTHTHVPAHTLLLADQNRIVNGCHVMPGRCRCGCRRMRSLVSLALAGHKHNAEHGGGRCDYGYESYYGGHCAGNCVWGYNIISHFSRNRLEGCHKKRANFAVAILFLLRLRLFVYQFRSFLCFVLRLRSRPAQHEPTLMASRLELSVSQYVGMLTSHYHRVLVLVLVVHGVVFVVVPCPTTRIDARVL